MLGEYRRHPGVHVRRRQLSQLRDGRLILTVEVALHLPGKRRIPVAVLVRQMVEREAAVAGVGHRVLETAAELDDEVGRQRGREVLEQGFARHGPHLAAAESRTGHELTPRIWITGEA